MNPALDNLAGTVVLLRPMAGAAYASMLPPGNTAATVFRRRIPSVQASFTSPVPPGVEERTMNDQNAVRLTDHELIEQISAHHPAALSVLYDRFSKLLYGIILSVVRDTDDAEDLLQEVFAQVWRSASTYNAALGAPKRWLARMAHNRAIDLLRSRRYQQKKLESHPTDEDDNPLDRIADEGGSDAWQSMVQREHSVYVTAALAGLPDAQQSLIRMAFFDGYTHQEIAGMTGIPLGTVKTRIRSGMQALRARLVSLAGEPM